MVAVYMALAILPAILIGWFIYAKDKNKESTGLLVKLFIGGVASCFLTFLLTALIERILPGIVPDTVNPTSNVILLFFQVMIGIALIEEFSKWFAVYVFGYKSKEFDEIYDAIVYCAFVSLGFATFENVLYVLLLDQQLVTALLRAVTAVPGHACDAIVMGYFIGLAKKSEIYNEFGNRKKYLILSLVVPMVTHGFYDFLIMAGSGLLVLIWVIFVIGMYIFAIRKVNHVSKKGEKLRRFIQCPVCGNHTDGKFCPYCGSFLEQEVQKVLTPVNNICPNCHNIANGNFCPYCGTKIK